jgi:hypothetical protein
MILAQATPAIDLSITLVTVIGTVAITVIGALVAGIIQIIRVLHETKAKVEANTATLVDTGIHRDAQLGRIEVLVDGRYSQVLQELATVKALLATRTGTLEDRRSADSAQRAADDQAARVVASVPPVKTIPDP